MARIWFLIATLLLASTALVTVNAQDESRVNVYLCYEDGECGHSVTSQELTQREAEIVLGAVAPSADASIVCMKEGDCVWSKLSESDIETVSGGDGIIEPLAINLDDYPAELLEIDFEALENPSESSPSEIETPNSRFWVVMCQDETCHTTRSKTTKPDAEILIGQEAPEGDFFILCDEEGCRWQLWTGDIQPLDGTWLLETYPPTASNCPEGGIPIDSLVTSGEREATFSKPAQPVDIFSDDTSRFDRVQQASTSLNNYVLSLGIGSGQFSSQVVYDWTVVQDTFVIGNIVIDLPSIYGGRCVVYIPWEMHHTGA